MGHPWTNWSLSQKVQIFGERRFLIKCSVLYGCLSGSISFLIFKKFYMIFKWGQSLGTNLGFGYILSD